MADQKINTFTGQAAAALTAGLSGKIDSAGKIAVGGANEKIDGIITRSVASGEASGLSWGIQTVTASEAVSAGAEIAPAASGKFESADSTDWVAGKAITAAAGDGSTFQALIYPPGGGYVKA
jgi:hypothetical protein